MATAKKTDAAPVKLGIAETREALAKAQELISDGFTCYMCNTMKKRDKFHVSTDPNNTAGVVPICKECAKKIALRVDKNGEEHEATKESVQMALRLENKPFIELLWNSAIQETENLAAARVRSNVWAAYSHLVAMPQYVGLTYFDSDQFKEKILYDDELEKHIEDNMSEDILEMFKVNKKTVLRFLGYDPFEHEPPSEQPLLYAKLVGYFDDSVKDDGLKLEAVIEIVQVFKDVKTINDAISQYKKQLSSNPAVITTIKSLAETKQKMVSSALALAKDNGISENNNNRKSKGAGTLTGIIKELQEMNLDEAEVNTFDYETNAAIEDIMTRNHQNQLKQLNPDENDWEKEVVHQKSLLFNLQKERDNAVEFARILKKENKELKEFLQEKGLIDEKCQVIEDE